jgi:two-component system, sensor histidine kinase and response regulator
MALRAIEEQPPDVVLLDLMMPVLDGWGVMERLGGMPSAPPVIVISAATSQSNVDRAFAMGAVGYITKPFILSEMIDKLNEVLAVAGDRGPRPMAAGEPPRV